MSPETQGIHVRVQDFGSDFPRFEVWAPNVVPSAFRGILGTLKRTNRVYSRYITTAGFRPTLMLSP